MVQSWTKPATAERKAAKVGLPTMKSHARHHRAGFTLIDLLVSIAVMGVLISLLVPSLKSARESARRVSCASNIRQVGYALQMYASDNKGQLPPSVFYSTRSLAELTSVQETMVLRFDGDQRAFDRASGLTGVRWDGLGLLIKSDYLSHPGSFYCPSHHGEHSFDTYRSAYASMVGEVFGNYQYRPVVGLRSSLSQIAPGASLIADGLRTKSDFNHVIGANIFRADLSMSWFSDVDGQVYGSLAESSADLSDAPAGVTFAWDQIDRSTPGAGSGGSSTPPPIFAGQSGLRGGRLASH